MFRCPDITNLLLASLQRDAAVKEIIVIDNTQDGTQVFSDSHKVRYIRQLKNIYVNPAWNVGVFLAREDYIAILNDDITVPEQVFSAIANIPFENSGIIGTSHPHIDQVETPSRFRIENFDIAATPIRTWGWGIFMVMAKKHYIEIPDDMKIWCGDDYLFHQNRAAGRTNGLFRFPIQTKMSTTSDDPIFEELKNNDIKVYESKYKI
jgi:glycosyltransferase involved in cell wall biosynthesis